MRRLRFAPLFVLLIAGSLLAEDSPTELNQGMAALADIYAMEGVSEAVSGLLAGGLQSFLPRHLREWTIDSMESACRDAGICRLNDPKGEMKEEIQKRLKERISKVLPVLAEEILYKELFLRRFGDEMTEIQGTVDRIVSELRISFNDRIDMMAEQLYSRAMGEIQDYLHHEVGPIVIDLTDLRRTLDGAIRIENLGWGLSRVIGDAIGDATVVGIQSRIDDLLRGELPPEAVEFLSRGPEAFEDYLETLRGHLPGQEFERQVDRLIHLPIFNLPNGVYCAILATSAARHFAAAFKGPVVDPEELRRGIEVTRVMIWQATHREGLSIDLKSLIDMTALISENLGISLGDLGGLGRAIQISKERWGELQERLDRLDRLLMEPLDSASAGLHQIVGDVQNILSEIQNTALAPIQDLYAKGEAAADDFRENVAAWIPEPLNGIPSDWEALKKRFGINPGILGEMGEKSPWDLIYDFAKERGIIEAYERMKGKIRELANDVNNAVSGALAGAVTEVADLFGMTDALSRALGIEDMPAIYPSLDSPLEPVNLFNAEFYHRVTDLFIPGKGISFKFMRVYRSRADFKGVLGHNWHHNYEERLIPLAEQVVYLDPDGKRFVFTKDEGVEAKSATIFRPSSILPYPSSTLYCLQDGTFVLVSRDGLKTYFEKGGLLVKKERDGAALSFHYDRFNRLQRVTDSQGKRASYRYRTDGYLSEVEDFAGRRLLFDYDPDGNLVTVTTPETVDDKNGKTVRYDYDPDHHITGITDPKGTRYLVNRYGKGGLMKNRIVAQRYGTEDRWMTVAYGYYLPDYLRGFFGDPNRFFRRIHITDGEGVLRRYDMNAAGETLAEYAVESGREALRRSAKYHADGSRVGGHRGGRRIPPQDGYRYIRNELGHVTEMTGPDGEMTVLIVNQRGQILQERRSGSDEFIRYRYDENDNITEVKVWDREELVYRFRYDDMDQLVETIEPVDSERFVRYRWDDRHRLRLMIGSQGEKTAFSYDDRGRVIRETFPDGSFREYEYNDAGQLAFLSLSDGAILYHIYDTRGNLVARRIQNGAETDGATYQTFRYDDAGRLIPDDRGEEGLSRTVQEGGVLLRYPSGSVIYQEWDGKGYVSEVYLDGRRLVKNEYDSKGRIVGRIFANGIEEKRAYDRDLLFVEEWKKGDRSFATRRYRYDERSRLIAEDDETSHEQRYQYDRAGRLMRDRQNTNDPSFDRNGNRKSDDRHRYRFDALGRLVELQDREGRPIARYRYDTCGRRIAKTLYSDGQPSTIRYVYDGWNRIAEYRDDRLMRSYVYDGPDRPIAFIDHDKDHETIYYYHLDRRGSVAFITDHEGGVVGQYHYSPYGQMKGPALRQDLAFASVPYDPESGLYYFKYRYYDPERGLFLTPDPLYHPLRIRRQGPFVPPFHVSYHRGGDYLAFPNGGFGNLFFNRAYSRRFALPPTGGLDRYLYAGGDPINYKDPLGLDYVWISGEYRKYPRGSGRYADLRLFWIAEYEAGENPYASILTPVYDGVSGPWGNGPLPPGEYNGHTIRERRHPGMMIDDFGWSLNADPEFDTDRSLLRIHPDGGVFGSLGCVAVDRESYMGLYYRLEEYLRSHDAIDMSVIIRNEGSEPEGVDRYINRQADWLMTL